MVEFSTLELVSLGITVGLGILNIVQLLRNRHMKKDTFKPIYNGLIGVFNDVKNREKQSSTKLSSLYSEGNPYGSLEVVKMNYHDFIRENIQNLASLREHIVPILKTIEPNQDKIFQASDFALTTQEKEFKDKFNESWMLKQEIEMEKSKKELASLKSRDLISKKKQQKKT